jgi:hypothetical protein
MQRNKVVLAGILCVALPGGFYITRMARVKADPALDYTRWEPDSEAIRQAVEQAQPQEKETPDLAQRRVFAEMFKKRFRERKEQIAIGLRFLPDGTHIKLMCPARMEPWLMDGIALTAWKESKAIFGRSFDVDIYETLIGTRPRLIGTLRLQPNRTDAVQIVYDFPARKP